MFTSGGTVQAGDGIYLERKADQELLALCQAGNFVYILTPRQMGKSSLMVRTAQTLASQGIQSVIIDLTQIGTELAAEQWYLGFLTLIEEQLDLETDVEAWWESKAKLGVTQRLTQFFQTVLLKEIDKPVVLFVDEIDTTLGLEFTDDLFTAIRFLYVARAHQPEMKRLSVVLIGVATPGDLIRDARRTPFNIGHRVDLTDFTVEEAMPLAAGFGLSEEKAQRLLGKVLAWTGGHPYLTQRLCESLVNEWSGSLGEADVDRAVGQTFLGERSEQENNLQFVRDMLTKRAPEPKKLVLETYRQIHRDKVAVADEEQSLVKSHLKLAGVVQLEGHHLKVRNPVYREVFDSQWIQDHWPETRWQRLKPALPYIAGLSAVLFGVTGLAVYAIDQSDKALKAEAIAEQKAKETEVALEQSRKNETAAEAAAREAQRQKKLAQTSASLARRRLQQVNTARKREVLEREKAQKAQKLAERRQREAEAQKSIAIEQRAVAEQQRIAAEQATAREKEQTIVARKATQRAETQAKLATLKEQAASGLYWLSATNPTFGFVLAIDTMNQSQSISDVEVVAQSVLLKSIQRVQEIKLLQGHQAAVLSVSYSPDGTRIVSGSLDNTVRIWDAKTGQPIGEPLQGHQNTVWSVSYSPDGRRIVSGSSDNTVRIWDAKTGQAIGEPLQGHQNDVYSVSFSPDGTRIVSGSRDKTVRIWEVGPESLTRLACDRFRLHPLLHQPEKVTSDPSIIEAAIRSKAVCKQHFPAWDSYRASQPGFPKWLFSRFQQLLADWLNT
ncbi:WD-repeat protein [Acaryochloris marina MBIC11017]|uniref:WD-repeat protein n=2 Tax=Acaryochloris marina TaxID=155978 RepID=B0CEC8_ACAM1|nr:WD-repeat protein [Acaryochloris marina MBIC11017]